MRRVFILLVAVAGIGLLPIGAASFLDFWADRDLSSFRTASIWARDLLHLTSRERLYVEAAEDPNGAAYIRWALRRGFDPNYSFEGWRPIDEVMYDLFGGCDPPLGPFEALARSGVDLDGGRGVDLLGFAARECRRPDLVLILIAAGADPARVGGSDGLVRLLGTAVYRADARNLWTWLIDHGATPCVALGSIDDPASMVRRLTIGGLADLADRAATACAAKTAR